MTAAVGLVLLPTTLWLLLARPGMLVTEYIAGRRQRYVGPLKLYLTFSVIFFVLASLAPSWPPLRFSWTSSPRTSLSVTHKASQQQGL